jgi:hypothetical protein
LAVAKDVQNNNAVHMDVEHSLVEIAQKTEYAYKKHTGEPLDSSLIRIEQPM